MVKAKNGLEIDEGGGPFLAPADTKILVLLSASVERFGVSRMRDFLLLWLGFSQYYCLLPDNLCLSSARINFEHCKIKCIA